MDSKKRSATEVAQPTATKRAVQCQDESGCVAVIAQNPGVCAETIGVKFAAAVGVLTVIPTFLSFWSNYNRFLEEVYGTTFYDAGVIPMRGTCFFRENGFIHSTVGFTSILEISAFIMTMSTPWCFAGCNKTSDIFGAMMKPNECPDPCTPYTNKYANVAAFPDVLKSLCNGKTISRWFEFYVSVSDSNRGGCPKSYRANVIGMDFDTGLLVLRINNSDPFNDVDRPFVSNTFLRYGNSYSSKPGARVYCVYTSRVSGTQTIAAGVVGNNKAMAPDGSVTYEIINTDVKVSPGAEGAPLINDCGLVIGLVIGTTRDGLAVGVTSNFLQRIYEAIEKGYASGSPCYDYAPIIQTFGFRVYNHGTLKMSYHAKGPADLAQAFLAITIEEDNCPAPCNSTCITPVAPHKGPEYWRKRFYTVENNDIPRFDTGIILDSEPCDELARATAQCVKPDPNYGRQPTQFVRIEKGDWITHIDNFELGNGASQHTPDIVLFGIRPCTCITIHFRKRRELFTEKYCLELKTGDNLDWVSKFQPCCEPCLLYNPEKTLSGMVPLMGQVVPCDAVVDRFIEVLKAVQCWVNLIRWFVHTLPQVYRATFYSNFNVFMTQLNEWISVLVMPQPAGMTDCKVLSTCPLYSIASNLVSSHDFGTALNTIKECLLCAIVPTPQSICLTLCALSRACVSYIAVPSIQSCVMPITDYDFVASFAHPSDECAFEQLFPNYIAMAGSKFTEYAEATAHCFRYPDIDAARNVAPRNVAPRNVAPRNVAPQEVAPQAVPAQDGGAVAPQDLDFPTSATA